MPLPPSRKDVTGPPPLDTSDLAYVVRHLSSASRQIDPGLLGGRAITPRPVPYGPSQIVGDDGGGDAVDDIQFLNTDRIVATSAGTFPPFELTYEPIEGSLHLRWDGDDLEPTEWTLDGQTVTFTNAHIHVDDVLTAAYAYIGEDEPTFEPLTLRAVTQSVASPTTIALPDGTEVGDLIVVAYSTMRFDGGPGDGTVTDPRMTQVGYGAWVGIATDLSPVTFGGTDRRTGAVATFAPPASYLTATDVGPGPGPSGTLSAPVMAAAAAVLVVTEENPNGFGNPNNVLPSGYVLAAEPANGAAVCKAGIFYWSDVDATSSPAGSIYYECHVSGFGYATAIGIQVSE